MSLKFAVLGAGRIGQVHARAINASPDATLAAVADALPTAAQAVADTYGCTVATIADVLADASIDGVLICTPTDTHADLIEKFTDAGKAVFCEKPIDLGLERVRACLDHVEKANGQLMLGFNRRFDPHFQGVIAAVQRGDIGTVEQVNITSRDPGLPPHSYIAVSGGIFRDMMIHDFDIARVLLGEKVETVQASAAALVDPSIRELNDYDTASAILTTKSGKQAVISNSRRASYGYDQRIEAHGSLGAVRAKNQRPVDMELATANGYQAPPLHDFFMTRYIDAYANEIASFVAAIKQGQAMSPSGIDGLRSLEIADAAVKSVETGQAVHL